MKVFVWYGKHESACDEYKKVEEYEITPSRVLLVYTENKTFVYNADQWLTITVEKTK